jgi:hypothetical protein
VVGSFDFGEEEEEGGEEAAKTTTETSTSTSTTKARIAALSPQALANVLWSLAALRHNANAGDPRQLSLFLDALAAAALAKMHAFEPQGLANSAWALGVLKHLPRGTRGGGSSNKRRGNGDGDDDDDHRGFLAAAADAAAAASSEGLFEPQHLSNMLWGFARLCGGGGGGSGGGRAGNSNNNGNNSDLELLLLRPSPAALDGMLSGIRASLRSSPSTVGPQEVFNTVWALATLRHVPGSGRSSGRSSSGRREFDTFASTSTSTSTSTADLLRELSLAARSRAREMRGFELANTAWAFAVLAPLAVESLSGKKEEEGAGEGEEEDEDSSSSPPPSPAAAAAARAAVARSLLPFARAAADESVRRGEALVPRHVSTLLWALGRLEERFGNGSGSGNGKASSSSSSSSSSWLPLDAAASLSSALVSRRGEATTADYAMALPSLVAAGLSPSPRLVEDASERLSAAARGSCGGRSGEGGAAAEAARRAALAAYRPRRPPPPPLPTPTLAREASAVLLACAESTGGGS